MKIIRPVRQAKPLHPFCFPTDVPGAVQTRNRGINGGGDITGNFEDSSGNTHGFLATQ